MKFINKYIKTVVIIVVAISLFGGVVVYKNGGVAYTKYKVYAKLLYKNKQVKENQIIFIGDSIVNRCNLNALYDNSNINNEGISGNNTMDILDRLDNVINLKPSTLFLHFGVNDLRQEKGQINRVNINKSIDNYSKIIDRIKNNLPNTKIYIESVLYVDNNIISEKAKTDIIYNFHISNDDITIFNIKLKQLALDNKITYINHDKFNSTTQTDDGIHPTLEGYFELKNDLKEYVRTQ